MKTHRRIRATKTWLVAAVFAGSMVLSAPPSTADVGDIKFAVAQDYPSSTITYTGSASPGAVAHLYRDGHADAYADLVIANTFGGPVVLYGVGGGRFSTQRTIINNSEIDASAVQVSDFNADGIPDIVSGGYTNEDGKGDLIILNALITNDASILYGLGGVDSRVSSGCRSADRAPLNSWACVPPTEPRVCNWWTSTMTVTSTWP
jgi:hypothetical protein